MVMEFRLEQGKEKLILPVPPPDFNLNSPQDIIIQDVNNVGEISKAGNRKLLEIVISSFFPNEHYSFIRQKTIPKPFDCTNLINRWKNSGNPIKLIISETSVNHLFLIENFSFGVKAGSRDVYFDLTLKEYRRPTSQNDKQTTKVQSSSIQKQKNAPDKPKSYKVVSGDTLIELARRFYSDASKYKIIADKNGIKDPKKLQIGQVLILP